MLFLVVEQGGHDAVSVADPWPGTCSSTEDLWLGEPLLGKGGTWRYIIVELSNDSLWFMVTSRSACPNINAAVISKFAKVPTLLLSFLANYSRSFLSQVFQIQ
jgi:hypothetical protein